MYKILLAADGSESSFKAARKTLEMAVPLKAEVTVLSVVQVIPVYRAAGYHGALFDGEQLAMLERDMEEAASETLEKTRRFFQENGLEVKTVLTKGQPADVICQAAEEGKFDLIVIGSRGLGTIKGLVLGSVSNKVIHNAKTSVLIVK